MSWDEDIEDTRELHIWSPVLGIYPYILIQFESNEGHLRFGVDYDMLSPEEVMDILREVIRDVEEGEWVHE